VVNKDEYNEAFCEECLEDTQLASRLDQNPNHWAWRPFSDGQRNVFTLPLVIYCLFSTANTRPAYWYWVSLSKHELIRSVERHFLGVSSVAIFFTVLRFTYWKQTHARHKPGADQARRSCGRWNVRCCTCAGGGSTSCSIGKLDQQPANSPARPTTRIGPNELRCWDDISAGKLQVCMSFKDDLHLYEGVARVTLTHVKAADIL